MLQARQQTVTKGLSAETNLGILCPKAVITSYII